EQVKSENDYFLGHYEAVDGVALASLPEEAKAEATAIVERETQGALAKMAIFPMFMFVAYVGLILFFKSKGGYKPKVLGEGAH
ncbi:MAG: hypothetical protein NWR76_07555, partial [Opitutales bacterium]|nr:hypothetical protein [Opitutales bacterium]